MIITDRSYIHFLYENKKKIPLVGKYNTNNTNKDIENMIKIDI